MIRRMIKWLGNHIVNDECDAQMARIQDEADRRALASHRDELQSIYREIEGARDLLDESKPMAGAALQ